MSQPDPRADQARFEVLYRSTRRDLLAYLIRRSRDADQAADLLAETYLIAWRKLDAVPSGEQARMWLFGVARNLLLKGSSRQRAERALVQALAGELRSAQAALPPGDLVSEALRAALLSLSERDREILTLTAWEGLTPSQVAQVIGMSPNAVRIRLHRARARLRRQIGEDTDVVGQRALQGTA